jgi:hypothetical protein
LCANRFRTSKGGAQNAAVAENKHRNPSSVENQMKKSRKSPSTPLALGSATKVTKGSWGPYSDEQLMQLHPGLTQA